MKNQELKLYWKKYLKDEITESEFSKKTINSEYQRLIIDDQELSLEDLPAHNSIVQKFEHFALTFPVSRYFNPYINYLPNIYREYSEEGKHKESIRNLRACIFFLQRRDHFMSDWPESRILDYREMVIHLRKLLPKTTKEGTNLKSYQDNELIGLYPMLLNELKKRGIIRSRNIVGELGEYYAIKTYSENKNLPSIKITEKNSPDIDAESEDGKRYAIKSMTHSQTGLFRFKDNKKYFDFLIIVKFNETYQIKHMYELSWEEFIKFRTPKIVKGTNEGWVVTLTQTVEKKLKKVF